MGKELRFSSFATGDRRRGPAVWGLFVAEHAGAFFAADGLAEVVGVDLDGDALVARLDALAPCTR